MNVSIIYRGFDRKYFLAPRDIPDYIHRQALRQSFRLANTLLIERVKAHNEQVAMLDMDIAGVRKAVRMGRAGRWGFYLAEEHLVELEGMLKRLCAQRAAIRRDFEQELYRLAEEMKLSISSGTYV